MTCPTPSGRRPGRSSKPAWTPPLSASPERPRSRRRLTCPGWRDHPPPSAESGRPSAATPDALLAQLISEITIAPGVKGRAKFDPERRRGLAGLVLEDQVPPVLAGLHVLADELHLVHVCSAPQLQKCVTHHRLLSHGSEVISLRMWGRRGPISPSSRRTCGPDALMVMMTAFPSAGPTVARMRSHLPQRSRFLGSLTTARATPAARGHQGPSLIPIMTWL